MFSAGTLLGKDTLKSERERRGEGREHRVTYFFHSAHSLNSHQTESRLDHKLPPIIVHDRQKPITNLARTGDILLLIRFFSKGRFNGAGEK